MSSDRLSTMSNGLGDARPNSRRVEVLTALLERYNDLIDPMRTGEGNGSTGLLLMPHDGYCLLNRSAKAESWTPARCTCWMTSLVELERLIRLMREDRRHPLVTVEGEKVSVRKLWWHLNAWYIAVEHTSFVPPQRTAKNKGKHLRRQPVDQHGVPLRQVRVLRSSQAREQIALKAVEWLSASWGLVGEPMLPRELVQAA